MTLRILTHARHHAIAYLALVVAMGGTSYAAVAPPRNSVGAAQIKTGAVRSAEVLDRSLLRKDFKPGQLPRGARGKPGKTGQRGEAGPSYVATGTSSLLGDTQQPAADPDFLTFSFNFTLPTAGPTLLQAASADFFGVCTNGMAFLGLYVDGAPVPGTNVRQTATAANHLPLALVGAMDLTVGPHVMSIGLNCPTGDDGQVSASDRTYLAMRVGAAN